MTNRCVVLIALGAVRMLVVAQPNSTDRWQIAIQAARLAEDETTRMRQLHDALSTARNFGESDARLFETVVALAQPCASSGCEEQRLQNLDYALRLRQRAQPADLRLANQLMTLGALASGEGRHREALQCYRDALQIREKASVLDGGVAQAFASIAKTYHQMGDKAQARLIMDHALESRQRAGEPASEEFAGLLEQSGDLYSDEDAAAKGRDEYEEALHVRERIWGKLDPRLLDSTRAIAEHMTWQLPAYAEMLLLRVRDAARQAEGPNSEEHYAALSALAGFYARHKRLDEADRLYSDAFAVRSSFGRAGDSEGARCLYRQAAVRMSRGRYAEAIELGARSLAIRHTLPADPRNETLPAKALLAEAYLETSDPAAAERLYREFAPAARDKNPGLLLQTAMRLSQVHERQGDIRRAVEKLETAVETLDGLPSNDAELAASLTRLGMLYSRQARPLAGFAANMRANRINWANLLRSQSRPGMVTLLLLAMTAAAVVLAAGAVSGYAWLEHKADARIAALSPPGAGRRIQFHGEGAPLFAMRFRNLLLSVLTAGVYAFWARAEVKRFLYAQAEFENDRLEYHGTGRQLLIGWMKGLPVVALILAIPQLLPGTAGWLAAFAAAAILWPVVRAGAHRYRMHRVSWRGVRFGFHGSTFEFQMIALRWVLLTIASCGLLYPEFQVRIRRFLYGQTSFGDRTFRFTGTGRDLLPQFLLALPLTVFTFGIFWAWWSAFRHRYFWAHTSFGSARFRCDVTGLDLLSLWAVNAIILASTLGFGLSWVTVRSAKFWTRHVELTGDPDLENIRQDAHAAQVAAEEYADFLGFDFGFLH